MTELTEKDREKLRFVLKSISEGLACSFEKNKCLENLDSVLNPKCAVCRKPIEGGFLVLNDHKMHEKCSKRYKRK